MDVPWGVVLLAVAAGLTVETARRLAARVLPAEESRSEELLGLLLIVVLIVVSSVAVLGFAGVLSAVAILMAAVLLYLASRRLPEPAPFMAQGGARWPRAIRWPAILTWILIVLDLAAYLPASPVDWDAATYHLHLPARWLQEGRIFHLPTVFGDNAAAFAPQNGALFFTWQMALSGRDAVVNVSQLLCLAFLGLALYRICRLLGVGRESAALAALSLPWLAPVRRWAYSANVDVFMVAFAFGACYWMLRYRHQPKTSTLIACGLASGLAAGTKTVGLPLAVLVALPLIWAAVHGRRFGDVCTFFGCAFAGGGWWFMLNFWRYGNPLFPVKVSLGPLELPGAYGAAAIRAGEFHLDGMVDVAAAVIGQYGATTCLLMVLGLFALVWRSAPLTLSPRGRGDQRAQALVLLFQAFAWAGFFFVVVPHNDQARFLMPTLVASLVGWGLVLDRVGQMSGRSARFVWLAGVAAVALASRPWGSWAASFAILERADVVAWRWFATVVLCGAAVGGLLFLRRRRVRILIGWAVILVGLTIATMHADAARPIFFAGSDYRGWGEGYLPFNHPSQPPARIAYTGANVPYALAGVGWRHRVVYVDTQGEQGDGFYQHWARDPREFQYHKPGLNRGRDDAELWLRHLDAQEIDTLVIFRLHRAEQRYIHSTSVAGFPIEQAWARQRPERFEPIFTGQAAEVYRLLPAVRDPQ